MSLNSCLIRNFLESALKLRIQSYRRGLRVQGGLKKVSHYRELLLNRIKNRQLDKIFHQF